MSAERAELPRSEWIAGRAAARLLGVSRARILQMAEAGSISSRRLPGCPIRFDRRELEALAKSSIHRAAPQSGIISV